MGREDFLIVILDVVAANTTLREEYQTIYQEWVSCKRQLQDFRERMHSENIDVSYISFQLQQLDEAQLRSGEQEELEAELDVLSHAEDIKRMLSVSAQALTSDEYDVCQQLKVAVQNLNRIEAFYSESKELAERLESCRIEIADVCAELEQAAEDVAYNPERMACIEERLSLIYTLQKKHHCATIDDLLALTVRLQEQMDEAQNADQKLAELEARVAKSFARLEDVAKQLTTTRVQASTLVGAQIVAHLQELGMPAAQIQFERSERSTPDASGMDSLKLLFSANKNVPVQDVAQIASGGEIARLMLSFKAMLANHQQLPTIVFDEIDTGVSGKMAEAMARMMQKMSGNCQVICITHLPQIAAMADKHFLIHKEIEDGFTKTDIVELPREQMIEELARMLGGSEITDLVMQNAVQMKELADKSKM
jgi:DNA repair protein RecN (Recombination protein N)